MCISTYIYIYIHIVHLRFLHEAGSASRRSGRIRPPDLRRRRASTAGSGRGGSPGTCARPTRRSRARARVRARALSLLPRAAYLDCAARSSLRIRHRMNYAACVNTPLRFPPMVANRALTLRTVLRSPVENVDVCSAAAHSIQYTM